MPGNRTGFSGRLHAQPGGGSGLGPGTAAGVVALLGFAGRAGFAAFARSAEFQDGSPHPLDRWSRRVISALAEAVGGRALFPFEGPPHLPFQRWALRAEPEARPRSAS